MKYDKHVILFASLTAFQIAMHVFSPNYAANTGLVLTICALFYMAIEKEDDRINQQNEQQNEQ